MTDQEFEALSGLLRLREKSASAKALRMVLVEGHSLDVAAAATLIQVGHIKTVLASASIAVQRAKLLQGVVIPV
jgi:hypothetical protein